MAIELIQKEQKPGKQKTYKIGDTFKLSKYKQAYILARIESVKVHLVRLDNGNEWHKPVSVSNDLKITQEEFDEITNGKSSDFIQTDYTLTEI